MTANLEALAAFLWGPGTLFLILATGLYFTVGTRFLPFTRLGAAFKAALQDPGGGGEISGLGALCTSLAATLGTGNIIGVATAIAAGGPGALFYMVVAALLGMATKYAEGYLAVQYRRRTKTGYLGGPFLYLEQGLGCPWLARIFAGACVLCCVLSMGTTSQMNGMVLAVTHFADPTGTAPHWRIGPLTLSLPAVVAGIATTLLVGLVLAGGIRRIARISTLLVPVMAGLYTGLILWLLIQNVHQILPVTRLILGSAFCPKAVLGGAAGYTVQQALRYGLGRGIFSNEAGMGSDPIAAASARTDHPARQGLISMLGPFLDTVVMCTLTGYAVLVTDAWCTPGLAGAQITLYALTTLPLPPRLISFFYMLCLLFFGFSSIIGWSFYGQQSLHYLLPHRPKAQGLFRGVFLLCLLAGAFLSPSAVWALADILCALMLLPNLAGVLLLSPRVFRGTKNYFTHQ